MTKAFVLLVTIMVPQQPPSSYQMTFKSGALCESARAKVLNDMRRVQQESEGTVAHAVGALPQATAVCAQLEE